MHWLTANGLERLVEELPERPLFADPEHGLRLSLAGAQDKAPVVCVDGRIGLPRGGVPSTHILKAPIPRLADGHTGCSRCWTSARPS